MVKIADGYVEHIEDGLWPLGAMDSLDRPGIVSKNLSLIWAEKFEELAKLAEQPPPFCGNPVPRKTLFLHRDKLKKLLDEKATELKEAEDRFSYRFGGKTWLSKAPPSEYKKVFSDLFEMCDGLMEPGEERPNVVLLQFYGFVKGEDGTIADGGISWHADDEPEMVQTIQNG